MCDWILETRTSCWEMEQSFRVFAEKDDNNNGIYTPLPGKELEQFQNDLNSLYCVVDQVPVSTSR